MSEYVRKAICFNVSNVHQRELLEWLMEQSGENFSGCVKTILYSVMVTKKRTDITSVLRNESDFLY